MNNLTLNYDIENDSFIRWYTDSNITLCNILTIFFYNPIIYYTAKTSHINIDDTIRFIKLKLLCTIKNDYITLGILSLKKKIFDCKINLSNVVLIHNNDVIQIPNLNDVIIYLKIDNINKIIYVYINKICVSIVNLTDDSLVITTSGRNDTIIKIIDYQILKQPNTLQNLCINVIRDNYLKKYLRILPVKIYRQINSQSK